ncbi:uncharacterized protein BKCO1_11300011 [Diplodia corticola]|uniref:Uncharacterized protein n=1 Tax=Diplodia corticola TaxID=236234 RepID=A0A1J9QL28_9PEZI|nr:uncharacterized protein BKCO1_11300011 [Diplodia corticola]OJD28770.1 hypothetical protein BKCO1_11300011 [Diplodia corticola]
MDSPVIDEGGIEQSSATVAAPNRPAPLQINDLPALVSGSSPSSDTSQANIGSSSHTESTETNNTSHNLSPTSPHHGQTSGAGSSEQPQPEADDNNHGNCKDSSNDDLPVTVESDDEEAPLPTDFEYPGARTLVQELRQLFGACMAPENMDYADASNAGQITILSKLTVILVFHIIIRALYSVTKFVLSIPTTIISSIISILSGIAAGIASLISTAVKSVCTAFTTATMRIRNTSQDVWLRVSGRWPRAAAYRTCIAARSRTFFAAIRDFFSAALDCHALCVVALLLVVGVVYRAQMGCWGCDEYWFGMGDIHWSDVRRCRGELGESFV